MHDSDFGMILSDPKSAYEEAGRNYRLFCLWREKIIGGYVAILGALGIGFHQSEGHCGFQFVLMLAAILVSLVFWMFNIRNTQFITACQLAGRQLEPKPKGVYSTLDVLTRDNTLTHGLAMNILVFAVVAASTFKICIDFRCWFRREYWLAFSISVFIFVLLMVIWYISHRLYKAASRLTI